MKNFFAIKKFRINLCTHGSHGSLALTHDPLDPFKKMTHLTHDPWVTDPLSTLYRHIKLKIIKLIPWTQFKLVIRQLYKFISKKRHDNSISDTLKLPSGYIPKNYNIELFYLIIFALQIPFNFIIVKRLIFFASLDTKILSKFNITLLICTSV